jgi:enoyl-CoA hydratase
VSDRYLQFPGLRFEHRDDGVLEIVLGGPGMNAVDEVKHTDLARVWR